VKSYFPSCSMQKGETPWSTKQMQNGNDEKMDAKATTVQHKRHPQIHPTAHHPLLWSCLRLEFIVLLCLVARSTLTIPPYPYNLCKRICRLRAKATSSGWRRTRPERKYICIWICMFICMHMAKTTSANVSFTTHILFSAGGADSTTE